MTTTMVMSSAFTVQVSLGVAGVLTLIASLVIKELSTSGEHRFRPFSHNLDVVILPLFFAFSFIVCTKVWEILS